MSIYNIDWESTRRALTPQVHRLPKFAAWVKAILTPTQWRQELFAGEYMNGSSAANWQGFPTEYNTGNRVRRGSRIFEATADELVDVDPLTNPDKWIVVCDDWRGSDERVRYTGQKLILEYILNHWFGTTWVQPDNVTTPTRPAIYIDNNALNNQVFTVFANDQDSSKVYSSDIYTQSYVMESYSLNGDAFTIYVPSAFYSGLGAQAENMIRSIADKYVIAGIQYNIDTY